MKKTSKSAIQGIIGGIFTWEGIRTFASGDNSGLLLLIIGLVIILSSKFWE